MPWHQVLARLTITPILIALAVAVIIAAPQVIIGCLTSGHPALATAGAILSLGLIATLAYQIRKDLI